MRTHVLEKQRFPSTSLCVSWAGSESKSTQQEKAAQHRLVWFSNALL